MKIDVFDPIPAPEVLSHMANETVAWYAKLEPRDTDRGPVCPGHELALVGSLPFLPASDVAPIGSFVLPGDFDSRDLSKLYRVIVAMARADSPIDDPFLIQSAMAEAGYGVHDAKGRPWAWAIEYCMTYCVNPQNVMSHAEEVQKAGITRSARAAITRSLRNGTTGNDPSRMAEDIQREAKLITKRRLAQAKASIGDLTAGIFTRMLERMEMKDATIKTHIPSVDRIIGGIYPKEFTILAARPSIGKSALAQQIIGREICQGMPAALFSLEMNQDSVVKRMFSQITGVNASRVMRSQLNEKELIDFQRFLEAARKWPLWIFDEPGITPEYVRAKVLDIKSQCPRFGLVVIDYLQKMHIETTRPLTLREEVKRVSNSLQGLAMSLNVPILALAQIVRPPKGQKREPIPQLSDLKESGDIEQDADTVMILHRTRTACRENNFIGKVDLYISKQRNGTLGKVPLIFKGDTVTFGEEANPYQQQSMSFPKDEQPF